MPDNPGNLSTDLRGVGNLTIDAIKGITDIVESLHQTIVGFAGMFGSPGQLRTRGITGMVYRNIHSVTDLVGDGIDSLLGQLSQVIGEKDSSPAREAIIAALNGVLGDHLVARGNPLAIPMQFRTGGKPWDEKTFADAIRQSNGPLVIMVHGACMNDLQWKRKGHDHGQMLARDLGLLPVYLHYNTGLHISENGRKFSDLLETLVKRLPQSLELYIVGHSMGGLVSRSACHYGKASGQTWLKHLRKLIFLGTPHHGALLEKGGNWIDIILQISSYSAPFSRLGKIRSSGVTDLRHGNLLDDDWQGRDRFAFSGDQRVPVPLPENVQCCSVAAIIGKESGIIGDDLIGDGLVTVNSALGRHHAQMNLCFPDTHQKVIRGIHHMDLLSHPKVYETVKTWLKR
ncbi:MAG: hypothetical protein C4522_13365 [Desulfobacteraceae bacterium]|nr:MAG: hypothetical protein C4522_13365 [Desulfobacteraceae bacterium]